MIRLFTFLANRSKGHRLAKWGLDQANFITKHMKKRTFPKPKGSEGSLTYAQAHYLAEQNPFEVLKHFPVIKNTQLKHFLHGYANSSLQMGHVRGQQLLFVTGAYGMGKTTIVKEAISHVKRLKEEWHRGKQQWPQFDFNHSIELYEEELHEKVFLSSFTLDLTFDFNSYRILSFESFIERFHRTIIQEIDRLVNHSSFNTASNRPDSRPLLTPRCIVQILRHTHVSQHILVYIRILLKQMNTLGVNAVIAGGKITVNRKSVSPQDQQLIIQTESVNPPDLTDLLDELQDNIGLMGASFFDSDAFQTLLTIISRQTNQSAFLTTLQFFYSVFRVKQQLPKLGQEPSVFNPKRFSLFETQLRTGIETTDFLFDILDHLCGFGRWNAIIVEKTKMKTDNDQIQSFQSTIEIKNQGNNKRSYQSSIKSNRLLSESQTFITAGNHIDVIVSFLNYSQASCCSTHGFISLFDNILLRQSSDSEYRQHFPLIVQIPDSATLVELQKLNRFDINNPLVLELPGFVDYQIEKCELNQILADNAISNLYHHFGRHHEGWRRGLRMLAEGSTLNDIGKGKYLKSELEAIKFSGRFNQLFLDPQVTYYLGKPQLADHLYPMLRLAVYCQGLMDFQVSLYYHAHIVQTDLMQAMIKNGLFNETYYQGQLFLTVRTDLCHLARQTQQLARRSGKVGLWPRTKSLLQNLSTSLWGWLPQKNHSSIPRPSKLMWTDLRYRRQLTEQRFNYDKHLRRRDDYTIQAPYFGNEANFKKMHGRIGIKKTYQ